MSVTSLQSHSPKAARKETIRELASRHLKDPNHTTTDEEIRNATVVVDEDFTLNRDVEKMFKIDNTTITSSL